MLSYLVDKSLSGNMWYERYVYPFIASGIIAFILFGTLIVLKIVLSYF